MEDLEGEKMEAKEAFGAKLNNTLERRKKAREGWGKEKGSCSTAAAKGITRWQAVRLAIRQLPEINSHTDILRSLGSIEDYLSDKPKDWENGPRYLERGER